MAITYFRVLVALPITTREPSSRASGLGSRLQGQAQGHQLKDIAVSKNQSPL